MKLIRSLTFMLLLIASHTVLGDSKDGGSKNEGSSFLWWTATKVGNEVHIDLGADKEHFWEALKEPANTKRETYGAYSIEDIRSVLLLTEKGQYKVELDRVDYVCDDVELGEVKKVCFWIAVYPFKKNENTLLAMSGVKNVEFKNADKWKDVDSFDFSKIVNLNRTLETYESKYRTSYLWKKTKDNYKLYFSWDGHESESGITSSMCKDIKIHSSWIMIKCWLGGPLNSEAMMLLKDNKVVHVSVDDPSAGYGGDLKFLGEVDVNKKNYFLVEDHIKKRSVKGRDILLLELTENGSRKALQEKIGFDYPWN